MRGSDLRNFADGYVGRKERGACRIRCIRTVASFLSVRYRDRTVAWYVVLKAASNSRAGVARDRQRRLVGLWAEYYVLNGKQPYQA